MEGEDLALVCATLGGLQTDGLGREVYAKSPDCLENLKDLQRYLRRDNPENRDVFLQLGKWNTVRQDLVPILKQYHHEPDLVLQCVKVLVFLTMPVSPLSDQVTLQVEYLQQFKAAILEGDAIAVIVSHLEGPLEQLESGSAGEEDWKMFQLFLTLLRNLLGIPDYVPHYGSAPPQLSSLQCQLLEVLFKESVMELLVTLTQYVAGSGGLRNDNLLILEIIHHMFSGQQPDLVAKASERDTTAAKHSRKTSTTLQSILLAEKDSLKRLRNGDAALHSPFAGVYVQVARDGTKTILSRNPHQSPLENLMRKPQIKRGRIKRIAPDVQPLVDTPDRIYVLLKDFADDFLTSGYNILMQSIKEDIGRERVTFESPEVTFFEVVQFFTSYMCCLARKSQTNPGEGCEDGDGNQCTAQTHLCGRIAATMDETMFTMVILKWQEFAESAKDLPKSENYGPLAAAGRMMKDMICMLDLVLRRSGPLSKEGEKEIRTARILLYKIFYDQTDKGILHFVKTSIKSFDIYKQPRSYLADLVEIIHIVFRILENFEKAGVSLRVLKKTRGGTKKAKTKIKSSGHTSSGDGQTQGKSLSEVEAPNASDLPGCADVESSSLDRGEGTSDVSVKTGEADPQEQCGVSVDMPGVQRSNSDEIGNSEIENNEGSRPADKEDGGNIHGSLAEENDEESSEEEAPERTKEESLDFRNAVGMFADNVVVRNYCWLLKFYSGNRATINHYIVRMLQRICEDHVQEPMMYQVSILQTFYNILSNPQVRAAEDHKFMVSFLSKVVRRLFKKLKAQPLIFVELLFWKTRTECHNITTDYMLHSLRKATGGSSESPQRINIADALGDDEDALPSMGPDRDKEGSNPEGEADFSSDNEEEDIATTDGNPFTEAQEVQIGELFERFKHHPDRSELIALELDSSGVYTAARITRKLREMGLEQRPLNETGRKSLVEDDLQGNVAVRGKARKLKRGIRSTVGDEVCKRPRLSSEWQDSEQNLPSMHEQLNDFPEASDEVLIDLFNRHGTDKNGSDVIAESLGGEFTSAQVSRRLQALGLVKSDEKSSTQKSKKRSTQPPSDIVGGTKSRIFSEAHDQKLIELFARHGSGRNVAKVISESLDVAFKPAQVSRRLRALGLVKSKPRSAQVSLHANLTDSDEDDKGPATVISSREESREEGNAGGNPMKVKLTRKTQRVDLSDSESDVSSDRLNSKASSPDRKLADKASELSDKSRGTNWDDIDDDVPLSLALKKREERNDSKNPTCDPEDLSVGHREELNDSVLTNGLDDLTSEDKADFTSGAREMMDAMGLGRPLSPDEEIDSHVPSTIRQKADYVGARSGSLNASQLLDHTELPSSGLLAFRVANARKRTLNKGRRVHPGKEATLDTQDVGVSTQTYEDSDVAIGSSLQRLTNRRIARKAALDVVDTSFDDEGLNDF